MFKTKIFCKEAALILFIFITGFIYSCKHSSKHYNRNKSHPEISLPDIEAGQALAKTYCQSCHLLPEPSLLDTKSWEKGVLPQMGPRLGIFRNGFDIYPSYKNDKYLNADFYPSSPILNLNQWQNIIDYYIATSPDSLPPQKRIHPIKMGLPLFIVEKPLSTYQNATTSFIKINSKDSLHPIMVTDALRERIYFFNRQTKTVDSVNNTGPIVDVDFSGDNMLACNIGMLNPNNQKSGEAFMLNKNDKGKPERAANKLFDSLQRPVQITAADLNNDGLQDYVVCEFGFLNGAFSWMENAGNNKFIKHILRAVPGAIKAYIQDYNHDGLPDIWVLFAQGDEGIFLFTNKGHGIFTSQKVLQFPPAYGSSYFELTDFNKDGYPDIIYTCGDNADYSVVLKPYHGVYLFMNDRTNHFKQKYFFPINGCYKAIAKDYDGDGDLDIAAISFFADYIHQPEEGFVYLKNTGHFNFEPYTLPQAKIGRWLTMDAGDVNGDGKIDIVLGNFSIAPSIIKSSADWTKAPPFIILKNTGKEY